VVSSGTAGWEHRRLGCCGEPLFNVSVLIADPETMNSVPSDTDGEVG
jgi:hypothetical protein